MADDSARQIVGTVGGCLSCVFFWTAATLANDRLLNHLEKRYYNNKNDTNNNNNKSPSANNNNSIEESSKPRASSFRKRIEKLTNIANYSWTKDTRLLFYVLTIICAVTYCLEILIMVMTSFGILCMSATSGCMKRYSPPMPAYPEKQKLLSKAVS